MDNGLTGVVVKSTGSWYLIRLSDGNIVQARIKGKFRLDDIKHTNPVAVGDNVSLQHEGNEGNMVISQIHQRTNYIIRKASNQSKQTHIIASNIDQLVLVVTLVMPETSLGFIDRVLVTAEAYHVLPILVFHKSDLYSHSDMHAHLSAIIQSYQSIGYTCLQTSVVSGEGLESLNGILADKTTLIIGHSGVGKSSLLNRIEPALTLRTGSLSNYHMKGKHTTTFAEMHMLANGGAIIDTPGIREFGIVDIPDAELSHYFKDMKPFIGECRFNNCIHTNEPGCAVKHAILNGEISEERYESYLSILTKADFYS